MIESKLMQLTLEGRLPRGTTIGRKAKIAFDKKLITEAEYLSATGKKKQGDKYEPDQGKMTVEVPTWKFSQ